MQKYETNMHDYDAKKIYAQKKKKKKQTPNRKAKEEPRKIVATLSFNMGRGTAQGLVW